MPPVRIVTSLFRDHSYHDHSLNSLLRDPCVIFTPAKQNKSYLTNQNHANPLTLTLATRRSICKHGVNGHIVFHSCPLSSPLLSLTVDDDSLFLSFFQAGIRQIPRSMHERHVMRMKQIWDWGCLDNSASSQSLSKRLKYIWTHVNLPVTFFW